MKTQSILTAALLLAALTAPVSHAAVLVSNLVEAPSGQASVTGGGAIPGFYYAVSFTTGSLASSVTGAAAILGNFDNDPLPNTAIFEASIWTNTAGLPGSQLAAFDNNPTLSGALADNMTTISFGSSGISLAPGTTYWLAIRNTQATGPLAFLWRFTDSGTDTSTAGWSIGNGPYAGAPGEMTPGFELFDDHTLLFELSGSTVPEPSAVALLGLSGLALLRRRR